MPRYTYGGQALIEGVLMRGRDAIAVALRHPDGRIVWATERLDSGFHGTRWSKMPLLRGLVVLYETLIVGTRWLVRSASLQAADEGVELGKGSIALMLTLTLVAGIGVFFLLPLFIASVTTQNVQNGFVQHLVEGLIRVGIFIVYLLAISMLPDLKRVFQYHAAEHKAINAFEAGEELVPERVQKFSLLHVRCGTAFLLYVMVIAIFVFAFFGRPDWYWLIASRILALPLIAGLAYEVIRFAGKHADHKVLRAVLAPGLWLQRLTTREPSLDQVEVSIRALQEVLRIEGRLSPEERKVEVMA